MNTNTLTTWLISTIAILIAAFLLPGVTVDNVLVAFVVAVVLGLINTFIRPLLLLLTLPINLLTLGLFTLVINGLMIMLTSAVVPGFHVRGLLWAIVFSIILWAINFLLRSPNAGTTPQNHV